MYQAPTAPLSIGGVLDDGFMQSGRPVAEARLLFEIGHDGAVVLDLRRRLGLDSGQ